MPSCLSSITKIDAATTIVTRITYHTLIFNGRKNCSLFKLAEEIVRNRKHVLRRNVRYRVRIRAEGKNASNYTEKFTHRIGHTGPMISPVLSLSAFITIGLAETSIVLL